MAAEVKKEIELEIAHVLFIDIVGYSKLSINEQRAAVDELTKVVRSSDQYQKSDAAARLIKISTGDGMGLVFYTSPEAPARCAIEISLLLKEHPRLQLRMGVHSGPVSGLIDVNDFLLGLAQIESHTGRSEAAVKILAAAHNPCRRLRFYCAAEDRPHLGPDPQRSRFSKTPLRT